MWRAFGFSSMHWKSHTTDAQIYPELGCFIGGSFVALKVLHTTQGILYQALLWQKKTPAVTELKTSTCLNPSAPKLIILMSMQEEDHAGNVCTGWFKNSKCHTAEIKTENTKWWLETVREYFIRWQHKHSCERPQCLMICFCEQWKNPVLLQLCAPGLPYPHQIRCSFCQAFSQWLRHP